LSARRFAPCQHAAFGSFQLVSFSPLGSCSGAASRDGFPAESFARRHGAVNCATLLTSLNADKWRPVGRSVLKAEAGGWSVLMSEALKGRSVLTSDGVAGAC
jgi:hypothetical protein